MIVVDASAAIKWLLPEPGTDQAQALLESGGQLIAPALIQVEVAAALGRKVRMREIELGDGETAFHLWLQCIAGGVIALAPDEAHLRSAWDIAAQLKHPLQGCLYLAVAEHFKAALVTADRKFAKTAGRDYPRIQALGA